MKQLFCRLRPCVQVYVFLLGVAAVTPTAALAARFSDAPAEDRLLQTASTLPLHFAARGIPPAASPPPASLLLKTLSTLAAAEMEIDSRQGDPLAVDGETPAAVTTEQGAAPFSREQNRASAEDWPAALHSAFAASAGGDNPASVDTRFNGTLAEDRLLQAGGNNPALDMALRRFQTRLEQLRKLLETLRYLASHTGAVNPRFNGDWAEDRLQQAASTLPLHFAAREPPPAASPPPASLLLKPLSTLAAAKMEIDSRQGDPLAVDGETPAAVTTEQGAATAAPVEALGAAPFSREQSRALAEDWPAALHSAFAASAGGDNPASGIALGRFYMRLEQLRKLLETLRHRTPYAGSLGARFNGALPEDRLLQAPAALRIHFAAREEYPPAASPPPASLLLKTLSTLAGAEMEIDSRQGDPLAVDGETPAAVTTEQGAATAAPVEALGAAPFSREQSRASAEDWPAALHSAFAASAGGANPALDMALRRFQTRLEQLRKLLETLRHLRPPHIGAGHARFGGTPAEDRLQQAASTLPLHFAAREPPPAASPPPASLLLKTLPTLAAAEMETDFRHGDPLAVDSETPAAVTTEQGAAPFSPEQRRAFSEDSPVTLRSVRQRCVAAGLMKSVELPLTIRGAAS